MKEINIFQRIKMNQPFRKRIKDKNPANRWKQYVYKSDQILMALGL